ncbi:MAG: hypothetical protein JSR17_13160 [Proteobacteria bacterium]|nr:hypothetical protein [Pseudomonadota bacterium]
MRVLSINECHSVNGSAFIEGFVADDFAVGGAVIGLLGAISLGMVARERYHQQPISAYAAAKCTVLTAWQAAKYGLLLDGAIFLCGLAKSAIL